MTTEEKIKAINDPENQKRLDDAHFPPQLVQKPIESFQSHKKWLEAVYQTDGFLRKFGLACIFGGSGTGKSQMATVVGRSRVMLRGRSAFYCPLSRFLLDFEQRDRLWEVVDDQYYAPNDLFLDNCHLIHQTGMHHAWIDALLDRRLQDGGSTTFIFTATPQALPTYLPSGVSEKLNLTRAFVDCHWPPIPQTK